MAVILSTGASSNIAADGNNAKVNAYMVSPLT